jgi:hypothetical protein
MLHCGKFRYIGVYVQHAIKKWPQLNRNMLRKKRKPGKRSLIAQSELLIKKYYA